MFAKPPYSALAVANWFVENLAGTTPLKLQKLIYFAHGWHLALKGEPLIDEVVQVTDDDSFATARQLARDEGWLVGISCGAAAWAAIQLAKRPENTGKMIVVIIPSFAERFLSTALFEGL